MVEHCSFSRLHIFLAHDFRRRLVSTLVHKPKFQLRLDALRSYAWFLPADSSAAAELFSATSPAPSRSHGSLIPPTHFYRRWPTAGQDLFARLLMPTVVLYSHASIDGPGWRRPRSHHVPSSDDGCATSSGHAPGVIRYDLCSFLLHDAHDYIRFPSESTAPSREVPQSPRKVLRIVCRLPANNTASHSFTIGETSTRLCPLPILVCA
ncbi:hypothetical protein DFH09DRAFT_1185861 [Mycena vulgaris]|nr:hypothetical protein DFH09DRAFT_1185861 [Mycena vulgaris]